MSDHCEEISFSKHQTILSKALVQLVPGFTQDIIKDSVERISQLSRARAQLESCDSQYDHDANDGSSVHQAQTFLPSDYIFTPSELALLAISQKFKWSREQMKSMINLLKSNVFNSQEISSDLQGKIDSWMTSKGTLFKVQYYLRMNFVL